MQEAFHDIHTHENSKGNIGENEESEENHKNFNGLKIKTVYRRRVGLN